MYQETYKETYEEASICGPLVFVRRFFFPSALPNLYITLDCRALTTSASRSRREYTHVHSGGGGGSMQGMKGAAHELGARTSAPPVLAGIVLHDRQNFFFPRKSTRYTGVLSYVANVLLTCC